MADKEVSNFITCNIISTSDSDREKRWL